MTDFTEEAIPRPRTFERDMQRDPEERPFTAFASLVRQARLRRGQSQRQLSRALGMSDGYVGHLESGRFRPNVPTLEAGYITAEEFENPIDEGQLARLNEIDDLTDREWESVRDFARYVKSRRQE